MSEEIRVELIKDEDWDFKGADTTYMTHGLHPYPARMIPQIARRLIKRYSSKGDLILDPFCGTGGVLVEAKLKSRNSVGIDINPLACFLAEARSRPVDPDTLREEWRELKRKLLYDLGLRAGESKPTIPDFSGTNIHYWFKDQTIEDLAIIRERIDEVMKGEAQDFFKTCFSATVREASGTRKGEFKLYRIPDEKWKKYNPDVLNPFINQVEKGIKKMEKFYEKSDKKRFSKVYRGDTRKLLSGGTPEEAKELLLSRKPKAIITSPPYGDSRTTVAYGQFSRYSSLWLGFDKEIVMDVDKLCLGGDVSDARKVSELRSSVLAQTVEAIKEKDERRAKEVIAFFSDLHDCLKNMNEILAEDGYCCIVIADRTVKRVQIPTHAIIAEMGVNVGFENDVVIYPREIPTKKLPKENAPENIPGLKGKTMSRENIVVLKH